MYSLRSRTTIPRPPSPHILEEATSTSTPPASHPRSILTYPFRRRRYPRKKLLFFLTVLLILSSSYFLLTLLSHPTSLLLYYKYLDYIHSESWIPGTLIPFRKDSKGCRLRKEPLVWIKGEDQVSVVWEVGKCTTTSSTDWKLKFKRKRYTTKEEDEVSLQEEEEKEDLVKTVMELDYDGEPLRTVYSSRLKGLRRGVEYEYEIVKRSTGGNTDPQEEEEVVVRRHSFVFPGHSTRTIDLENDDSGQRGRRRTSTPSETIRIGFLSDNQFNLRTFSTILKLLVKRFYRHQNRRNDRGRGEEGEGLDFLIHGGDFVQNPHDLNQWQTDFWDPITRTNPPSHSSFSGGWWRRWLRGEEDGFDGGGGLGSRIPLLVARGNHDWDKTGRNVYVGGSVERSRSSYNDNDEQQQQRERIPSTSISRGTYFSFSPHPRVRILILDSNLVTNQEQLEQEEWLMGELDREEWKERASLRIVLVHTAPWIEWWDERAWNQGNESKWSTFVRHRLLPILIERGQPSLILSGHSHAYSRGFLPNRLSQHFTGATKSSEVEKSVRDELVRMRRNDRKGRNNQGSGTEDEEEEGIVLVTAGGSGGTLDKKDRVENWGLCEEGKWGIDGSGEGEGNYHFGMMSLHLEGSDTSDQEAEKEWTRREGLEKVYRPQRRWDEHRRRECRDKGGKVVEDRLEWKTINVDGKLRDRFGIVGNACSV